MRRHLIGVLVVLVILGGFLALRLGGRHAAVTTLDKTLAALPPGVTATHGATDYDPVTDTLTVHDLVLSRDGRKLGSAAIIVVTGAHLAALQAVFDPAAYPDGHPAWTDRRALLGHVDVKTLDIEPKPPGTSPLTIRRLVLDGLSGRPFIRPPTPPNRTAADFQADAGQALSFHDVAVDGVDMAQPNRSHLGIGTITLTDYDAGKLGSFSLKDMEVSVTQGSHPVTFSLANVGFEAADLHSFLAALAESAGLDPLARSRAMAAAYGSATIRQFDLDGMALKISPGPRIGLDSLHSEAATGPGGVRTGTGTVRGLSVAADDTVMPAPAHALLQRFGTDRLVLDEDATAAWNNATRHLDLERADLMFRGLATLHLTAALDGIDREGLRSQNPRTRQAAIQSAVIDHVALEYDDQSLVGRIIGVAAMQQNTTPDQVRAEAAAPLAALSMLLPDEPDAAAQISAFLANPQMLRITLNPPSPVSLAQVAAAPVAERARLLGLKIEAK